MDRLTMGLLPDEAFAEQWLNSWVFPTKITHDFVIPTL